MRALDLFCGAGGASMGLHRAGFDVVGVDLNIKRAKHYPFTFICGDALRAPVDLKAFDLIWASPPCQAYTCVWNGKPEMRDRYPRLIEPVREMLVAAGVPFVMENVRQAPIRPDVVLTGAAFGLDIVRRRHFEVHGFRAPLGLQTTHMTKMIKNAGLATVAGHGAQNGWRLGGAKWKDLDPDFRRRLSQRNNADGWREAMGIDWMTRDELAESVPPAYAEFIGRAAIEQLTKSKPPDLATEGLDSPSAGKAEGRRQTR